MPTMNMSSDTLIQASANQYKILNEEIYFNDAIEAQEYAKNNPGKSVVRNSNITNFTPHNSQSKKGLKINKTPKMILDYLNKHIISQDDAKKEIALAMYYHDLKSIFPNNKDIGVNGPVMIVGPTGSGKTFIVQKACEYIDTVFIHVDTSSMVPEGIMGYSLGDLGKDILRRANDDIRKAEHCVVFFDEMDKLFKNEDEDSDKVASQLLRLIEGTKIKLPYTYVELAANPDVTREIDSTDMQFILGGAFQWILDDKSKNKSTVGFAKKVVEEKNHSITLEDLYEQDIPKELLGRMNTIVNLHPLTENDYSKILTQSASSPLREFINKIEFHGDTVNISNDTLIEISKMAANSKLGVRSIKQTLKTLFKDALFSAPEGEVSTHTIICKGIDAVDGNNRSQYET